MKDFFISYTRVDEPWAVWVAWVLEEAGYSVEIQAWDFRPGSNFMLDVHRGMEGAQRLIAILTPDYVKSDYCKGEWAAGVAADPAGLERKVVPVRVVPCEPPGLLRAITYIDLVGLGDEEKVRKKLLEGLKSRRMKPEKAPPYPGATQTRVSPSHPVFPAETATQVVPMAPYIPRLPPKVTDLDVRRFMQASFEEVQRYFKDGLEALERSNSRFAVELQQIHSRKFVAEVYVDGNRRSHAKIWLGSFPLSAGEQIGYVEGTGFSIEQDTQFNDMLTAVPDAQGLHLRATLNASLFGSEVGQLNPERMTGGQAAEYLWRRFIQKVGPESSVIRATQDDRHEPRFEGARGVGMLRRWQEYAREQIPSFFGLSFSEAIWNTGFIASPGHLFLLVTLEKRSMAGAFQYEDCFLSPSLFKWQSQNRTTQESKHGRLLRNHAAEGNDVHLFVRAEKKLRSGNAAPFIYCGPVSFDSWQGEKPITVILRLEEPVPVHLREKLKVPSVP